MSFHNIRDKFGRFKSVIRKKISKPNRKRPTLKPEDKHILNVFLLDDTGSMAIKSFATAEGFNTVLADALKSSKEVLSTNMLFLFGENGYFQVTDNATGLTTLRSREHLGLRYYNPNRPHTALWWATIQAIRATEMKLSVLAKNTNVILTIFTDGEDNQSNRYEFTTAKELISKKQQEGWVINFIGAGDKAFVDNVADSVGIFASNTMNYHNSNIGTTQAFSKMSLSNVSYRSKVAAGTATVDGFFAED